MRSRRSRFESACRIAAFALLGWLLGSSIIGVPERRVAHLRDGPDIERRLEEITRAGDASTVHLDAPVVPSGWVVDWLAALARGGIRVTWSGTPPAIALTTESVVDPWPTTRISIAAPRGSVARLHDDASEIDTVRIAGFGATVLASGVVGRITAAVGSQRVVANTAKPAVVRRVLVVARASWEAKFIVDALEERGWPVEPRFAVAPGVDVSSRNTVPLDTSRFAAVIVLDSTARPMASELDRFVRAGGGLILVGAAAQTPALASLAPGSVAPRTRPDIQGTDTIRLGTTGFYPVAKLEPGAVILERRDSGVSMAARRIDAGRVLQIGYDDSWRWRMAGGPSSERAHRDWWSRVVSSVAYVPAEGVSAATPESAPLAYLVDRLGAARAEPAERSGVDPRIILALIMILLLAEWTSRRFQGLR